MFFFKFVTVFALRPISQNDCYDNNIYRSQLFDYQASHYCRPIGGREVMQPPPHHFFFEMAAEPPGRSRWTGGQLIPLPPPPLWLRHWLISRLIAACCSPCYGALFLLLGVPLARCPCRTPNSHMRHNGLLILNSEKAIRDQMTKNTTEEAE